MVRGFLIIGLAALLTGCPGANTSTCNADPSLPECIVDGGAVGGLTYRTHPRRIDGRYRDVEVGACGGYQRLIDWQMPGGAPADGHIVQHIRARWSAACPTLDEFFLDGCPERLPAVCVDSDGQPRYEPVEVEFWEAWPLPSGATTPAPGLASEASDTWLSLPQAVPEGTFEIVGVARFYADEDMGPERPGSPGSPWERAPGPLMDNVLPTTSAEPDFWRDDVREGLRRVVRTRWTCCPRGETIVEEDSHDR